MDKYYVKPEIPGATPSYVTPSRPSPDAPFTRRVPVGDTVQPAPGGEPQFVRTARCAGRVVKETVTPPAADDLAVEKPDATEPLDAPDERTPAPRDKSDKTEALPLGALAGESVDPQDSRDHEPAATNPPTADKSAGRPEEPTEEQPIHTTRDELLEIAHRKQAESDQAGAGGKKLARASTVEGQIDRTNGPFLEVGGPTQHFGDKPAIDLGAIRKPLIISNVSPDYVREGNWSSPIFGEKFSTERPTGLRGSTYQYAGERLLRHADWSIAEHQLDVRIDATKLPEGAGYLGGLYACALQPEVEQQFVATEAPRALEQGGMLVVEKMELSTFADLSQSPYFDIVKARTVAWEQAQAVNVVARRNDLPYTSPVSESNG